MTTPLIDMIKEYEKYHGIALARFAHTFKEIKVLSEINDDNSSYILNETIGLYIKVSKKRITPWQFTFLSEHHRSVKNLSLICTNGYVVFVCGEDGLCCIAFNEYFTLINGIEDEQTKSIQVSRTKNKMYQAVGTDGKLRNKVADSYIEF